MRLSGGMMNWWTRAAGAQPEPGSPPSPAAAENAAQANAPHAAPALPPGWERRRWMAGWAAQARQTRQPIGTPAAGAAATSRYFALNEKWPLGPALDSMLLHAAMSDTLYGVELKSYLRRFDLLPGGWRAQSWQSLRFTEELRRSFAEVCPNLRQLADGRLCDPDSGLVMKAYQNRDAGQFILAFGGTTARENQGPLRARMVPNSAILLQQWRTNLTNVGGTLSPRGAVPASYERAAALALRVWRHLQANVAPGAWSLSLTGHSKGGAEAEYAALMNGLPAVCFCTPELGRHVLETASVAQLEAGRRNIQHYFVTGDATPRLGQLLTPLLGRRLAHVGTGYWLPPHSEMRGGLLKPVTGIVVHGSYVRSLVAEAARQQGIALVEENPRAQRRWLALQGRPPRRDKQ